MNATESTESRRWTPTARGMVLTALGAVTVGVAVLSVYISYQILHPRFGAWSSPTVGALDALWVVCQATEILAGNNRRRAWRVQCAGLVLTAVNAAIPTADLILHGGFDLAVILTPVAIVVTKGAWWLVLPSLGRRTSPATRTAIDVKRQQVADRLEEMEAEAAHRIELLATATDLERRVAKAETKYRKAQLKAQQQMTEKLHKQAESTQATITDQPLPALVAHIELPDLDTWTPTAPALPVTAGRDASAAGPRALTGERDGSGTDESDRHAGQSDPAADRDADRHGERDAVTLAELATVAGVTTPEPGEPLTDAQIGVVLRHLRYSDDPPLSYRKAGERFRHRGFQGSEERVRRAWGALLDNEGGSETAEDTETDTEEAGA
ncbi:hypothetical protein [Streptomyces sp. NPDC021608]|uniref:hypothetical protein n=1 Tax=Streptomyces sp. NPDC021608 TaxID=3154903 RepID=UPI003409EFBB